MGYASLMLIPVVFWLFIVMLVIAVSKPKKRFGNRESFPAQRSSGRQVRGRSVNKSFTRPEMRKDLFDIKIGNPARKKEKTSMFSNTGYDDYSVIGRKKDFVTGYDKKYSKDSLRARRSAARQYSHTYDGHEPWDKCVPKEKDPWDKDFYV